MIRSALLASRTAVPRHEFEVRSEVERRGGIAERGIGCRQPPFVRIVAGDQDRPCAEGSGCLQKAFELIGVKIFVQAGNLHIEHRHAGILDARHGIAQHGGILGQRRKVAAGSRRRDTHADCLVAELLRQHQCVGRRHRRAGQIGEGIDALHE
jgi:hypothetical protein